MLLIRLPLRLRALQTVSMIWTTTLGIGYHDAKSQRLEGLTFLSGKGGTGSECLISILLWGFKCYLMAIEVSMEVCPQSRCSIPRSHIPCSMSTLVVTVGLMAVVNSILSKCFPPMLLSLSPQFIPTR